MSNLGNQVSLKFLTLKTVFLTSMAKAFRSSELHALCRSSVYHHPQESGFRSDIGCILCPEPSSIGGTSFLILYNLLAPDDDA